MPLRHLPGPALQDRSAVEAQLRQRGLTIEQLRTMARQSGLSPEEIRQRVAEQGYDAALVDELFQSESAASGLEASAPLPFASADLLDALEAVGLLISPDSIAEAVRAVEYAEEDYGALPVFGSDVFRRGAADPMLAVPAGDDYVLGPGDRVFFVLTGDVEEVHTLEVTREGMLIVPRVGQMAVAGTTLGDFENHLEERLRTVYSDVGRDLRARIRFSVSIGRFRTIQVQVVGAVTNPGSYSVSAVATIIDALYRAGGPTSHGSYRHVRLVRGNDIIEADLYPYITSGGPSVYPRLRGGDVIHVPWVRKQVTLRGEIRNPAVYEIRDTESLIDVLGFAGGLLPAGRADIASMTRILPPEERNRLMDRVFADIPLDSVLAGTALFSLEAGDDIQILPIRIQIRNRVDITGAVYWAGTYELDSGMTLRDLIEKAGGLSPDAFKVDVLIIRQDSTNLIPTMLRHDFTLDTIGPVLVDRDEVIVFSQAALVRNDSVGIFGFVSQPGYYPFMPGMTAGDLVLLAGGFLPGAVTTEAEIARLSTDKARFTRNTLQSPIRQSVSRFVSVDFGELPNSREQEHLLVARDQVFIRGRPGYLEDVAVTLSGQFIRPGRYVIENAEERLSSVIERAGGLTALAVEDLRLVRKGIIVAVDYKGTRDTPGAVGDPILEDGDEIIAPIRRNTVVIEGAVAFAAETAFRIGMSVDDAISQAGGFTRAADRDAVVVSYPDGSRATTKKVLRLFRSQPPLVAGASIYVPEVEESLESFDWGQATTTFLQLVSATATLIIAANTASN